MKSMQMRQTGQMRQHQSHAAVGQGLTESQANLLGLHREIRSLLGRPARRDVWDDILTGRVR